MRPATRELAFSGELLERGFWLYAWEITVNDGCTLHYVGKTGDKASGVTRSPFDRISKHLGCNKNNNALRRLLGESGIDPEQCRFRFHAYGPLFDSESTKTHGELCDITSALEKALAEAMNKAEYEVTNKVKWRIPPDPQLFKDVRAAFAAVFLSLDGGEA